jgi:hypothetical protein
LSMRTVQIAAPLREKIGRDRRGQTEDDVCADDIHKRDLHAQTDGGDDGCECSNEESDTVGDDTGDERYECCTCTNLVCSENGLELAQECEVKQKD